MLEGRSDIERRLGQLGSRRREQQADAQELAREIRLAVGQAQGVLPMAEVARLLEIDRSTLYRVYADAA